jgi:hypothetical protein
MKVIRWTLGVGAMFLMDTAVAQAQLCRAACIPWATSCNQRCEEEQDHPPQYITCAQWWWANPSEAEYRDVGFKPGAARWIDEHTHSVCGIDYWTGSLRKFSDGCWGSYYTNECVNPVYHKRTYSCGETARQVACSQWGCTNHAETCRPCEGICM